MTEIERLREALEPAPWCKDALFLITTHGDGAGAQLVRGWAALCETIVDVHYFEPDADQRAEVMHRLTAWDDWQNDDTGPYFLALDYEDGSVSITRVTEGAALSTPPAAERGEWQTVPVVPTEAMIAAGWIDKEDVDPDDIWDAMLKAAPPSPRTPEGQP